MFEIETTRLRLLPLTHVQLLMVRNGFYELERSLGLDHATFELNAPPEFMEEFYRAINEQTIPAVQMNELHYLWFTHWLVIEKAGNIISGGIGATGLPDQNGETIIGYFIGGKFEGKGFATEAVAALTGWMFLHPELNRIIAFTEESTNPSTQVLIKNGFIADGAVEDGYKWSRTK